MPFYFRPEKDAVYESLKQSMDETGTLAYFDEAAPTKFIEDASPVELCVLFVQNQNGDWVTLCYASRGLTECECRFSQTKKETTCPCLDLLEISCLHLGQRA